MGDRARILATVPFRFVAVVHALAVVGQVFLAGALLDAVDGALESHAAVGGTLIAVAALQLVTAVPARWPGRMPTWVLPKSALVLVAETVQVVVGHSGDLAVHIPLGVTILVLQVSLGIHALRRVPGRARAEGRRADPAALR